MAAMLIPASRRASPPSSHSATHPGRPPIARWAIGWLGTLALAGAAGLALAPLARGAEPELRPEDLPHLPALEPSEALRSFEVVEGFRLELAAHEPQVVDPVAFTFDERGRLYVVEMRDYSERRPERLGRVRRLEDRDGDGVYETAQVFLEDLPWPTAVTCWAGGIFVGTTPDVLYARDDDGDGRAEIRETVFTGFASDYAPYATNQLNVQALLNSFHWGLDARIHGSSGMSGGKVTLVDSPFTRQWRERGRRPGSAPVSTPPQPALDLRGRDFSFDPHTLELRAETGGGQHGMSFDDFGRKFLCSNSDHLQIARYDDRYVGGNSWHPLPSPRESIAVDGPAAPVFRISPEEPWRVIRTRWRVTGLVQGLIEGGGRSSGYFTSATGLTIYRGDAYGPGTAGDAFVADCGSNLIHRKKLSREGCDWTGQRAPTEKDREFIASRDTWFRPVQFANAPDGCLWFADMYREVIEHPWSLPPNLKRLIDLNSGSDRGRLYRIAPAAGTLRRRVDLAALPPEDWIKTLSHPNGWHRDAASRLLVQSRNPALLAPLREAARKAPSALGRLHALHTLHALGELPPLLAAQALSDASPEVQAHALRLTEELLGSTPIPPDSPFVTALRDLAHGAPEPRLQLALSLGSLRPPNRASLLAELLRSTRGQSGEGLITDAAVAAAREDLLPVFQSLAASTTGPGQTTPATLALLAGALGRRHQAGEIETTLGLLARGTPDAGSLRVATQFAAGLATAGSPLSKVATVQTLQGLHAFASQRLTNPTPTTADVDLTRDAIRFLAELDPSGSRSALAELLHRSRPPSLQRTAVDTLFRLDARDGWSAALRRWNDLAAETRTGVLDLLLRQSTGPELLLNALADQQVASSSLSAAHVTALRSSDQPATRRRAQELLGAPPASRSDAIASILPALNLTGDPTRGAALYTAQCATCHRLGGQGHALGPDLESVRSQPKEKLVVAIVDPNREVQPAFLTTTVETTDGEAVTGLAAPGAADPLVLLQAGGISTPIPRAKIRTTKPDGRSLMPEGFESTLTHQQMADLLSLLTGVP
ncbi:MAG: c-type cytochrome [Verrucomicrobiales bacterium]|nr:c-type cytochrome [Verrucomicrobiales bacterium]